MGQRSSKKVEESSASKQAQRLESAREEFFMGNAAFKEGRYQDAVAHYTKAVESCESCDADNKRICSAHQANALSSLGVLSFSQGRFQEAQMLLENALDILRRRRLESEAQEDCGVDPSLSIGNAEQCIETLSLSLASRNLGPRCGAKLDDLEAKLQQHCSIDSMLGDCLNNIGASLEMQGQHQEARLFYEESLMLRRIVHSDKSLPVAESLQNLATVLDSQGQIEQSESLMREALNIYNEILGKDSEASQLAVVKNNLAVLCTHLGKFDEALELLEQALRIRHKVFGRDSPLTTCTLRNLAYLKNRVNKMAEMKGEGEVKVEVKGEIKEEVVSLSQLREKKDYEQVEEKVLEG